MWEKNKKVVLIKIFWINAIISGISMLSVILYLLAEKFLFIIWLVLLISSLLGLLISILPTDISNKGKN
jgi:hypothetical protein